MTENENTPEPEVFHSDPVINATLRGLNDKAADYRLLAGILTGKFDQNFSQWRAVQALGDPSGIKTPDLSGIETWIWDEATPLDLIAFSALLEKLQAEVHRTLYGHYNKKSTRASFDMNRDPKQVRESLVKLLDATLFMLEGGNYPVDGVTVEMVLNLPAIIGDSGSARKPRGDDGSLVWDFPSVRTDSDAPEVSNGSEPKKKNYRTNNSTVKFIVNGELPEADTQLNLGALCTKYFGEEATPQSVAKKFDGWADEYFASINADGSLSLPEKGVEREGVRYFLTNYGTK